MADDTPWYSTLDADTQAHATTKGWTALDPTAAAQAMVKAHMGAEKLIGHPADQVIKLPKDAADPSYQSIYDRVVGMSTPKTAEEYTFENVPEDDAAFIREVAVKHKLSLAAATGLAADLAARGVGQKATTDAAAETTKAANGASLRAAWGAEFDMKSFSAIRAAEAAGLPASILQHIATLPADQYRAGMEALVALGQKMGEAAMLRGGAAMPRDPTSGMTPVMAQERLSALQGDRVWGAKFLAGDAASVDEWKKLTTLAASGRVPRQ